MFRSSWPRTFTAVIAVTAVAALSACSSSSGGGGGSTAAAPASGGSTASSSGAVAAAKAYVAKYSSVPTSIPLTTPLSRKPPTGKKIFVLGITDPTVDVVISGYEAAAKLLGWTVSSLRYTDPTKANGLFQQALSQGADYIAYIGLPSAIVSQGIAAAKAKNVPVFQQDGLTEAKGPANGLYSQPDGTSDWLNKGKLSANFAISTTDAKAKVLMVNVEAFDVLALYEKSMKAELSAKCPDCSLTALGVQYADVIGSKVPALTVNYLRSHPEINYVIFPTGGFGTGFVQAATTAGIKIGKGGVQLAYQAPNDTNRQEIIDGKSVGALSTPNPYNGWVIVDAMARQSIGDPLTVNWKSPTPLLIQTKATTKNAKDEYTGPTGYEAAFKALWKI